MLALIVCIKYNGYRQISVIPFQNTNFGAPNEHLNNGSNG